MSDAFADKATLLFLCTVELFAGLVIDTKGGVVSGGVGVGIRVGVGVGTLVGVGVGIFVGVGVGGTGVGVGDGVGVGVGQLLNWYAPISQTEPLATPSRSEFKILIPRLLKLSPAPLAGEPEVK